MRGCRPSCSAGSSTRGDFLLRALLVPLSTCVSSRPTQLAGRVFSVSLGGSATVCPRDGLLHGYQAGAAFPSPGHSSSWGASSCLPSLVVALTRGFSDISVYRFFIDPSLVFSRMTPSLLPCRLRLLSFVSGARFLCGSGRFSGVALDLSWQAYLFTSMFLSSGVAFLFLPLRPLLQRPPAHL